ncbi:MAG TPA: urease accessory protein UreD, partial [Steroidobacteraceae bacterium]|nr:urease accessory protein UreD [Steroidobacteraceae bacterium]
MNTGKSWQARLELGFRREGGRTILAHRRHMGPLVVQRPFHPEGPVCHVYLVHPPGGIVGGDSITLQVDVETHAHALLTTPAATRFYRAGPHPRATVHQLLAVRGALEWLPQETIVFEGARAHATTRVELAGDEARFLGWEVACLGRPACGEGFREGELLQDFLLYRDGQPLLLDRTRLAGDSPALSAGWGLAGSRAMGTLLMYPAGGVDLAPLRRLQGGDAR